MKEVAVKTLTDSLNIVRFLQEAAIMAQFKHPNVVTLYGVVSRGTPVRYSITILCLCHSMISTTTENDGDRVDSQGRSQELLKAIVSSHSTILYVLAHYALVYQTGSASLNIYVQSYMLLQLYQG